MHGMYATVSDMGVLRKEHAVEQWEDPDEDEETLAPEQTEEERQMFEEVQRRMITAQNSLSELVESCAIVVTYKDPSDNTCRWDSLRGNWYANKAALEAVVAEFKECES